jgi:hypothetical protein
MCVTPGDPATNGSLNSNIAGGSSQFATFVQYFQAKSRLAFVSAECVISQATSAIRDTLLAYLASICIESMENWKSGQRQSGSLHVILCAILIAFNHPLGI